MIISLTIIIVVQNKMVPIWLYRLKEEGIFVTHGSCNVRDKLDIIYRCYLCIFGEVLSFLKKLSTLWVR